MPKTMTTSTLRENWAILKNRGTDNFTKKRGGITKNEIQLRLTGVMKGEEDASIIWSTTLWGIARGKPARRRKNGKATKDRRAGELHKEVIRGGGFILWVACNWDPIEEHLAVASDGNPTAVRAEGGEEDVMMTGESVEAMLAVKSQDKILGGASRPATTKEA